MRGKPTPRIALPQIADRRFISAERISHAPIMPQSENKMIEPQADGPAMRQRRIHAALPIARPTKRTHRTRPSLAAHMNALSSMPPDIPNEIDGRQAVRRFTAAPDHRFTSDIAASTETTGQLAAHSVRDRSASFTSGKFKFWFNIDYDCADNSGFEKIPYGRISAI